MMEKFPGGESEKQEVEVDKFKDYLDQLRKKGPEMFGRGKESPYGMSMANEYMWQRSQLSPLYGKLATAGEGRNYYDNASVELQKKEMITVMSALNSIEEANRESERGRIRKNLEQAGFAITPMFDPEDSEHTGPIPLEIKDSTGNQINVAMYGDSTYMDISIADAFVRLAELLGVISEQERDLLNQDGIYKGAGVSKKHHWHENQE